MVDAIKFAVACLVVIASIIFLSVATSWNLHYPLVYRSWSTQECVKVEPETEGTCEDLPDRYEIVWVR